jgi:5'-3' exonuclease
MSKNYMLVDGNSLGHFHNNAARLSIGEMQVQAIFGFLRALRQQVANYQNYTPVVLWDGASWRKLMFAAYKENRDKKETKNEVKMQAMKDAYKLQVPYIKKALRFLGIPQVWALNMEADDLGAILTDRYTASGAKIILLTGDKDWLQLVGPGVVWRDFANDRLVNEKNFAEFTGVDTIRQFIEVKALAGDMGDNIAGVGGIGQKGAVDFIKEYGSVANFTNGCILEKSIDVSKLPKKYRNLVEDEDKAITFNRNIDLMDLRTTMRPAPVNLQIDKGTPDKEKFQTFCDLLLFKSITQEFEEWLRVFPHFREQFSLAA